MATLYLDVDDEITSAASRMRASGESRVVLVLPAGSRLGTSRINFRLLAREAATNGRSLSIVSPEAATRALAASAGLPVYASVFEYEGALATAPGATVGATGATGPTAAGSEGDGAGGNGAPAEVAATLAAATVVDGAAGAAGRASPVPPRADARAAVAGSDANAAPTGTGAGALVGGSVAPAPASGVPGVKRERGQPGEHEGALPTRRTRGPIVVVLAILALAVGVAAVLGYLFLPSASVQVVVRPQPLGPMEMTVTADPTVSAPDSAASVVPAQRPTIDLSASGTYPATGKKITETAATGSVRWQNCDPTTAYTIPQGTVVRTNGGIAFGTNEAVFVPVAVLAGNPPSITCQTRDVGVTATTAGEGGNVPAGAITVVPASFNSVVVRVTNPAATSGGTHTETKLVSQKDVDAAKKALTAKLDAQLAATLAAPGKLPATGQTFPDTAARTAPTFDPDPAGLVGQQVDGFDLSATATGSVTVVDESSVAKMAEDALVASVPAGRQLVPGSTRVDLGEPTVEGQAVRYPTTAAGLVVTPVDPAQVRAAVAGKPIEEARQAAARFGDATISLWPSWASTVPTYDFRLDVNVVTETPSASAGASPASGGSSPAPGRSSPGPGGSSPAATPAPSTPGATLTPPSSAP